MRGQNEMPRKKNKKILTFAPFQELSAYYFKFCAWRRFMYFMADIFARLPMAAIKILEESS